MTEFSDSVAASMDGLAARDALVGALCRTLVGPSGADDMSWLSQRPPTVIDKAYSPGTERPIGPFIAPDGQEILNVLPVSLYVAGMLYGPEPPNRAEEAADVAADEDALDAASERVDMGRLGDDQNEDPSRPDELPADVDGLGRRRSISTSFRVPPSVSTASLRLDFGSYFEYPVSAQSRPWWKRESHLAETTLRLTETHEVELVVDGYYVTIGAIVRPTVEGDRLCTVWVRNDTSSEHVSGKWVSRIMFQTVLRLTVGDLLPYAPEKALHDSLDLLYREVRHRAIGHGCDVEVVATDGGWTIRTDALPTVDVQAMTPDVRDADGKEYAVSMAALAGLSTEAHSGVQRLIDDYRDWIEARARQIPSMRRDAEAVARRHLTEWRRFLDDIQVGWKLVLSDAEVQRCFTDASSAMRNQRVAYGAELRRVTLDDSGAHSYESPSPHSLSVVEPKWRPFQLAFILASLAKIVQPSSERRQEVDVIWMPTGGGKTEAYLGLAAFTILWERRQQSLAQQPKRAQGNCKVLMRYTLQLLTVQQLVRSASLICALELIRKAAPERYGATEVRLGAWVGNKLTPGSRTSAMAKLGKAERGRAGQSAEFLLTRCPWCAAEMGLVHGQKVLGYGRANIPNKQVKRLLASCPDPSCAFSRRQESLPNGHKAERGLPVMETDEDIYAYPPDFVIGTVDKVATMWFATDAQSLFGLEKGKRVAAPPALFIQDELHLISGPLGSLDGVFEWMLEELCLAGQGGRAPVYIASTATTRNFEGQIEGLYDRSSRLVPPPGLDISDSFFARIDETQPRRRYLAVSAWAMLSNAEVQVRVLATLAHFASVLEDFGADPDPYWTDLSFFSSRRVLGTLSSSAETKLGGFMDRVRQASGASSGEVKDGQRRPRRILRSPREITATGSEDVSKVLADLSLRKGDKGCIDLCFATSMIEVGLDVGRLGLMTVIGQPKGSSQYIQVSGRVGRSKAAPALVVDILGAHSPRDRSHYERFRAWHERLYASVESASVTPYTEPALNRSAPTVLSVLVQILGTGSTIPEQVNSVWSALQERLVKRASRFGSREQAVTSGVLHGLFAKTQIPRVAGYQWGRKMGAKQVGPPTFLLSFSDDVPDDRPLDYWQVLTSMRSVDPDAPAMVHANVLVANDAPVAAAVPTEENYL